MPSYGYVHVNGPEDNAAPLIANLLAHGVPAENIVLEVAAEKECAALQRLVGKMEPGDTLLLPNLAQLGRSSSEIRDGWKTLTGAKSIEVLVLDAPIIDTRAGKSLNGADISQLVLQVLEQAASAEQAFRRQRQAQGIAEARAKGTHLGRKFKDRGKNFPALAEMYRNGEISARSAAKMLGVGHGTFCRWVNEADQP